VGACVNWSEDCYLKKGFKGHPLQSQPSAHLAASALSFGESPLAAKGRYMPALLGWFLTHVAEAAGYLSDFVHRRLDGNQDVISVVSPKCMVILVHKRLGVWTVLSQFFESYSAAAVASLARVLDMPEYLQQGI